LFCCPLAVSGTWQAADITKEFHPPATILPLSLWKPIIIGGQIMNTKLDTKRSRKKRGEYPIAAMDPGGIK
jgi:hypothetical protein